MRATVERDSIINMAVALIRREVGFTFTPNKITGGVVVSGTFETDAEDELKEARAEVAELRRKRKKL